MPNNLPLNWCECKLVDICDVYQPKTISTKELIENGRYPVYGANGVIGKYSQYNHQEAEVLIGCRGSCGAINESPPFSWINGNAMVIHPKTTALLKKYLKYFLLTCNFSEYTSGVAIPQITRKSLYPLSIPFPPLAEQERIVAKIDALFADIDEGVECLKSAQAQIKQYRQSVLKSAFEGKLYKTTDWKEVDITKIIANEKNALKAGPFGSALKKEIYVAKGYKIYGQEQVISQNPFYGNYYINKEKYQELISCRIKPNDILISLVGTIGKVLILPDNVEDGIINPRLLKVTLDVNLYLPVFFKFYFESQYLRSLFKMKAHGATMDVLNLSILKELPFPLPTLSEQQRIVTEIEKRFAVADELEKAVNEGLEKADKLKQSILKKAFEGKLVPQNPNDEPASVLLACIKKSQTPTKGKKK